MMLIRAFCIAFKKSKRRAASEYCEDVRAKQSKKKISHPGLPTNRFERESLYASKAPVSSKFFVSLYIAISLKEREPVRLKLLTNK